MQLIRGIDYRDTYKYTLSRAQSVKTDIKGLDLRVRGYIELDSDGWLHCNGGYSWNGTSGPSVDTPSNLRASLFHDALYQLIGEGLLSDKHRKKADKLFYKIMREDGESWVRAQYHYRAVRNFGGLFV